VSRYQCVWCRKHFQAEETEDQRLAREEHASNVFDLSLKQSKAQMDAILKRMLQCPHCSMYGGFRVIPQKPPGHKVYWSKKEQDIIFWHDGTVEMDDGTEITASKATGHLLHTAFDCTPIFDGKSLVKLLEERGYDLTTLKFEIRKKVPDGGR
jgi:hypothetical protein